jgi:hypothetical protein
MTARGIFSALALLLVLLGSLPAEEQRLVLPQRNRAGTAPVIFYAAPNGSDANNTCLDASLPCTPYGAYFQAKVNWDFVAPIGGCFIKLARGTYTVPPGEVLMDMSGVYVGHYACRISGDVDHDFTRCNDPGTVIIDIPQGGKGFSNKDGIISVISCLTIRGANNAVGIWSQQSTVLDIADIVCGPIPRCIEASTTPAVNINGPIYLDGDMQTFVAAGTGTEIKFWYQPIQPLRPVHIGYWALAYGAGASVAFEGSTIVDSWFISGPVGGGATQCIPAWTGVIIAGGLSLPCTVNLMTDGKFYP